MNDWIKILGAFRDGKFPRYYHGLTPRFIIGGCQIPIGKKFETKELALEATRQMHDEMRESDDSGLVVVSTYCGDHNGPVMSLSEFSKYGNTNSVSFEEIWNRYGDEIVNGNYHIDSDERKILEAIFNR